MMKKTNHGFSSKAEALLRELQSGGNIAVPDVYPGSGSFNYHAIAYLNNAVAMCQAVGMDDFRVFGALYGIRHGIELWLKCMVQNATIDEALLAIGQPDTSFENVVKAANLHGNNKGKKHLEKALCVLRNISQDGLKFPECQKININAGCAEKAITFIRENGHLPRYLLATAWSVPILIHDLNSLWEQARSGVSNMYRAAVLHAPEFGLRPPMEVERIGAVCELLGAWDASGDAFRYPCSMNGSWYINIPHLSLDCLGELADSLESTVRCYDSLLEHAYEDATLRSPAPSYSQY